MKSNYCQRLSSRLLVKLLFTFLIFFGCLNHTLGENKEIKSGDWTFSFNLQNGYWNLLKWKDTLVSKNDNNKPPFNWGPGWPGGKLDKKSEPFYIKKHGPKWIPEWENVQEKADYKLSAYNWDEASGTLKLYYKIGDWTARETIVFGAKQSPDLLSRQLSLTYHNASNTKPALLAFVIMNNPVTSINRYFCPVKIMQLGPKQFISMKNNSFIETESPMLFEYTNNSSAIYFPDCRKDKSRVMLSKNGKFADIQSIHKSYGWALPGKTQDIEPTYISMHKKDIDSTLKGDVWKLFDKIGITTPTDRPEWIKDAVLYSFHPSGHKDTVSRSLGGFTASVNELLPRIKQLGFNTAWSLPVQDGHSGYCPKDYYSIAKRHGSKDEYKSMVEAFQKSGVRFIQDIVPHGNSAFEAPLRGNKPWLLSYDKDGNVLPYLAYDYMNKDWQAYMENVAKYYVSQFNVDGMRIDLADGQRQPNFMREDFPLISDTPKNIPVKWWREELQKNGNTFPPLSYQRASFGRRKGGMDMSRAIRAGVKSVKPKNGMVLGEVQGTPYMQTNDLVYEKYFCYYYTKGLFQVPPMYEIPAADFVRNLSAFFRSLKYAEPRDTLRMRYVDCHDSYNTKSYIGVGAYRAMLALNFLLDGVPMLYMNADDGYGVLLKKLITLRKAIPELRRGETFYSLVKSKPDGVFTFVRSYGEDATIVMVNADSKQVKSSLLIPPNTFKGKYNVWNCWTQKKIGTINSENPTTLPITLAPWEPAILTLRPISSPCPVALADPKPQVKMVPEFSAERGPWNSIQVRTGSYRTYISSSGFMYYLTDQDGNKILGDKDKEHWAMDFISDTFLQNPEMSFWKSNLNKFSKKAVLTKTDYGCKIDVIHNLGNGAGLNISYKCDPEKIDFEAKLKGGNDLKNFGLTFAGNQISRWQVNTAEGLFDDYFYVKSTQRHKDRPGDCVYRLLGTPKMWEHKTIPLDLNKPIIGAFTKSGAGVQIRVNNSLSNDFDNIMLLDKVGLSRYDGWHLGALWNESNPLYTIKNSDNEKVISLSFIPTKIPLQTPATDSTLQVKDLSIQNNSYGWNIKNEFYSLHLSRMGGNISNLKNRNNQTLIGKSDLHIKEGKYAQSNDFEAGVKVWKNSGEVNMLFRGKLKNDRHFGNTMGSPRTKFYTLYTFAPNSPVIKVKTGINIDELSPYADIFPKLQFHAYVAQAMTDETTRLDLSNGKTSKIYPLPDNVKILNKNNKELFSINNLKNSQNALFNSVEVKERRLNFNFTDSKKVVHDPNKWYKTEFTISVKQD